MQSCICAVSDNTNGLWDTGLTSSQYLLPLPTVATGSAWQRNYSMTTQDLLTEIVYSGHMKSGLGIDRKLDYTNSRIHWEQVETDSSYNMLGNPLSKTIKEDWYGTGTGTLLMNPMGTTSYHSIANNPTRTIDYSYWGADKYYQQKAVRQQTGSGTYRYDSFTDYHDSSATAGSKGQTYRVYDAKNGGIALDPNAIVPTGGVPWRYQVYIPDASKYSAQFAYDAQGRPTDVYNLQTTGNPWTYVHTTTTYAGDWGEASQVVEDYGDQSHFNRTTQTLQYDAYGRATEVQDASGKQFLTNYHDADGQIDSIYRADNGLNQPIATYTSYAMNDSVAARRGQVESITDNLSGVVQTVDYCASGGGLGNPSSVCEQNGTDTYSCTYTYNDAGDRYQATYTTPAGTVSWRYTDYIPLGDPSKPSRVFQTLNRLDSNGNPTAEEFHYVYDSMGKLTNSAFMQTPQSGQSGYGTSAGNLPLRRARAFYSYDPGGRLVSIQHYWDALSTGNYTTTHLLGAQSAYDTYKGLKSNTQFRAYGAVERTETYTYDADLDVLTGASYNDGLPNSTPAWSYDAAGNRTDTNSTFDNLNRATAIQGVTCTNDALGNRTGLGTNSYGWDVLNRMTSYNANSYAYRADGMRVSKTVGTTTTAYRYDGQMGMEDVTSGGQLTRYGLGARGIDYIENGTTGGGTGGGPLTTPYFPVYDGHGNMVALLSGATGNSYTVSNRRSLDCGGNWRLGASTGDPLRFPRTPTPVRCSHRPSPSRFAPRGGRYCGNLVHEQDDEAGLVCMRARYCEPGVGRHSLREGRAARICSLGRCMDRSD